MCFCRCVFTRTSLGPIPTQLSHLASLTDLWMHKNQLSGAFICDVNMHTGRTCRVIVVEYVVEVVGGPHMPRQGIQHS